MPRRRTATPEPGPKILEDHRAALEAKDNIEAMIRDMALGAGADDPRAFARELSMIFEGGFATRHLRPPEDVVPVLRRMAATLFGQHLPQSPDRKPGSSNTHSNLIGFGKTSDGI
jgi:hypothetical protein